MAGSTLEACAFGACCFGNRSSFILDLRLISRRRRRPEACNRQMYVAKTNLPSTFNLDHLSVYSEAFYSRAGYSNVKRTGVVVVPLRG